MYEWLIIDEESKTQIKTFRTGDWWKQYLVHTEDAESLVRNRSACFSGRRRLVLPSAHLTSDVRSSDVNSSEDHATSQNDREMKCNREPRSRQNTHRILMCPYMTSEKQEGRLHQRQIKEY